MKKLLTAGAVLGSASAILSVLAFLVAHVRHGIVAYSGPILALSLAALAVLLLLKLRRVDNYITRTLSVFFFFLICLTGLFRGILWQRNIRSSEEELICDATSTLASFCSAIEGTSHLDWIRDGEAVFFLCPDNVTGEGLLTDFPVPPEMDNPEAYVPVLFGGQVDSLSFRYKVAAVYGQLVPAGYDEKTYRRLPESCFLTYEGVKAFTSRNWSEAKTCLEKADSLGNGVASYYLHLIHDLGCGQVPDKDSAKVYLGRSSDLGYRVARYDIGKEILSDPSSSSLSRAEAEDILARAALVSDIADGSILQHCIDAGDLLQQYYRSSGRLGKALRVSRAMYSDYLPDLKYTSYLDNCLLKGRYRKARALIKEAESSGGKYPYAYCVHARMLYTGSGVAKDTAEAERLLRYAADSLGYRLALKELSLLYSAMGDENKAELWQRLYDIDFKTSSAL